MLIRTSISPALVCSALVLVASLSQARPDSANSGSSNHRRARRLQLADEGVPTDGRLTEMFRWKHIEYDQLNADASDSILFPDEPDQLRQQQQEHRAALAANYVPYNNVPMGATHHRDRLYVTVPRRRPGIPATLNYISTKGAELSSPTFRAYPSYAQNQLPTDGGAGADGQPPLVSVYRTRVDKCNRLWFVDTGLLEYPNNFQQIQRPAIWVMNLATDKLIRRFEIPAAIVQQGNGLASITVDVDAERCDDAFAYIPDLANYRLYTYDLRRNRIWSNSHNFFNFDPTQGDFDVAGQRFQWNDGIFSVALGPRQPDGNRLAYFHPMVGTNEFAIATNYLRDEAAAGTIGAHFRNLGTRGPSTQSAMHDYDERLNVMFFSQVATNGVSCWSLKTPLGAEQPTAAAANGPQHTPVSSFVHLQRNNRTMIYPSDLNVDDEGWLWMMTNSMPLFIYSRLDPEVYNFRVWRARTEDLVLGTVCDQAQRF